MKESVLTDFISEVFLWALRKFTKPLFCRTPIDVNFLGFSILCPVRIYFLKVKDGNIRRMYEICSKLAIKTQLYCSVLIVNKTHCSGVSIVDFKQVNIGCVLRLEMQVSQWKKEIEYIPRRSSFSSSHLVYLSEPKMCTSVPLNLKNYWALFLYECSTQIKTPKLTLGMRNLIKLTMMIIK